MPFKLVNQNQSPEDRASKYWLAKSLGCNSSHARRIRDWQLSKIERRFSLSPITKDDPNLLDLPSALRYGIYTMRKGYAQPL